MVVSTTVIECYFCIVRDFSAILIPKTDFCDIKILSGLQIRVLSKKIYSLISQPKQMLKILKEPSH